jgi:hypothetical protein
MAAPLHAQELRGVVVDSANKPVAAETVMLHNVAPAAGSVLGQTLTDSTGAFVFPSVATAPDGSVYFAAVRRDGQLYIGPMLRAPLADLTPGYRIEIGPGGRMPELGPAATAQPGLPSGEEGGGARLLLIPLGAAAAIAAWFVLRPRGVRSRRRLLIDIAELDERRAAAGPASATDDALWQERRAELLDELRHETR